MHVIATTCIWIHWLNLIKKCNYMCKHSKFYSFIVGLQRRPEFHKRGEYRFFLVDWEFL